jgi:glycosyltransferase involved in cell wall biosynthesis
VTAAPRFSIIVPAHNEQTLLGRALASIHVAIARSDREAEIVVVANRCTDRTEAIARAAGAVVVRNEDRNISAVRNAGVAASTGEVVVTIDADNVMHPDALREVDRMLVTDRFVGGGCGFVPERRSLGLTTSAVVIRATVRVLGIGGVMFWCRRADFDAVGGFDESLTMAEDLDFAMRLRRHGRRSGRRFRDLRGVPVVVCCRKFDTFGDWHILKLAGRGRELMASFRGTDTRFVDEYFYDYDRSARAAG